MDFFWLFLSGYIVSNIVNKTNRYYDSVKFQTVLAQIEFKITEIEKCWPWGNVCVFCLEYAYDNQQKGPKP